MPNISPWSTNKLEEGIENLIRHVSFDIFVSFGNNVRRAGTIVLLEPRFSSISLTNLGLQLSRTLSINITLKL
jgi:hypothetical protein